MNMFNHYLLIKKNWVYPLKSFFSFGYWSYCIYFDKFKTPHSKKKNSKYFFEWERSVKYVCECECIIHFFAVLKLKIIITIKYCYIHCQSSRRVENISAQSPTYFFINHHCMSTRRYFLRYQVKGIDLQNKIKTVQYKEMELLYK